MKRLFSSVVALTLVLSSLALADITQTGDAEATFTGRGPAGFKLEGKSEEVLVKADGTQVVVSVPLATIDTGIDLRNRHMREKYLETDKFPHAVLVVDRDSVQLPAEGSAASGQGKGRMTLHGQTKEVAFQYSIRRVNGVYHVDGKVPLNIKEFGIHIPSYLGVTVHPDIQTAVTFQFTESR